VQDLNFDRHVAEQPAVVEGLLATDEAPALDPARPVVLTGIGTSLHACRVAADWIDIVSEGHVRATAVNAHDLALGRGLRSIDQIIVVSHRGTKRYPNEVLRRASAAGCATVAVTGLGDVSPAADVVLRTCAQERASTHTVSYTAALTVLARLVCGLLGDRAAVFADALRHVPGDMARSLDMPVAEDAAKAMAAMSDEPGIVTGTGLDAITAAEAALKIKEGTYRWFEGMHAEFALHGTPAVFRPGMVAFLIRPAGDDGGRYHDLRGLLGAIGARVFECSDDGGAALRFAPTHPLTRPFVSILPFHRLVSTAAKRLGANPDLTHMETEPWKSAVLAVTL